MSTIKQGGRNYNPPGISHVVQFVTAATCLQLLKLSVCSKHFEYLWTSYKL
jgi:hypothetical protein